MELRKTCRYDRPFKAIFLKESNKDLLILLLNTCLSMKVTDVTYLNTELQQGSSKLKGKTLDFLLETNAGKIDLELNATVNSQTHPRNMAYLCSVYASNTMIGEKYDTKKNFIQLNLTYGLKDTEVFRKYEIIDEDKKKFVDNFKIYEFNMDKIMEFWYSKDEDNIKKYKYLIMLDLESDDLNKLSQDKNIRRFKMELDTVTEGYKYLEWMNEETDRKFKENSIREEAYDKGIEKGIKEGQNKIIISMLETGISIDKIKEMTKLSEDEIKSIISNNNE